MVDKFIKGLTFVNVLDWLIIVVFAIFVYRKLRKTESLKIISGIAIIYFLSFITGEIGLKTTTEILKKGVDLLVLGSVVIFHPELRKALKKIGGLTDMKVAEETKAVDSIEHAVFDMSSKKIGALILFDNEKSLANYSENRTKIDAKCSSELLQTIFYPKSRLHDGAVLIQDDRIAYAGCKLPITGRKRKGLGHLGTRHLAALENVERFNTIAVVVSEESGKISIVNDEGLHYVKTKEEFKEFFENEKQKKVWLEKIIRRNS